MGDKIVSIVLIIIGISAALLYYQVVKNKVVKAQLANKPTIESLIRDVKDEINKTVQEDISVGVSKEEYESAVKLKMKLRNALNKSVHGIIEYKIITKGLINQILRNILPVEEDVDEIIDFNGAYLAPNVKFEVLLEYYYEQYGANALKELIEQNELLKLKKKIEDGEASIYAIDTNDINRVWTVLDLHLNYDEKITVLSTLIYQRTRGFGIVDTIADMNMDGWSIGVSGAKMDETISKGAMPFNRSVWIYYKGKEVHLKFLTFENRAELERVVRLRSRFNAKAPLNEENPKVVTSSPNGSRITAVCPPMSTDWGCFVRNFTLADTSLEGLVTNNNPELAETIKNKELPVMLSSMVVKGERNIIITGGQGSGKSTWMTSMIGEINPTYTIRVADMTFENRLAEMYPERNTLQLREVATVELMAVQELLKKTNANVSIVGELAEAAVTKEFIKTGKVGSEFTMGTHHAKTTEDLIISLRNDLVEKGGFTNLSIAEQDVVMVVDIDIHMAKKDGFRFIERITEVVKLMEIEEYPEFDPSNPAKSMYDLQKEFYRRQTDRKSFATRDLMVFDFDNREYKMVNWFSPEMEAEMMYKFDSQQRILFQQLKEKYAPC